MKSINMFKLFGAVALLSVSISCADDAADDTTDPAGSSASTQFKITATVPEAYTFNIGLPAICSSTINWGAGGGFVKARGAMRNNYSAAGTYNIELQGVGSAPKFSISDIYVIDEIHILM